MQLVYSEVLHGSILGPLLFNLYLNDFVDVYSWRMFYFTLLILSFTLRERMFIVENTLARELKRKWQNTLTKTSLCMINLKKGKKR